MASRRAMKSDADPIAKALATCRGALAATALFSGALNLLMLAGAIYMLQVYDRVLTSRSVQTLVGLTLLLGLVFLVQGILDIVRQRRLWHANHLYRAQPRAHQHAGHVGRSGEVISNATEEQGHGGSSGEWALRPRCWSCGAAPVSRRAPR